MVSRVNFLETEPGRIDDVARVVRELVHPGIRGEDGYAGYIVLGNRETRRNRGEKVHPGNHAPLLSLGPGDYPDEAPNAERTFAHVLIDDD